MSTTDRDDSSFIDALATGIRDSSLLRRSATRDTSSPVARVAEIIETGIDDAEELDRPPQEAVPGIVARLRRHHLLTTDDPTT